MSTDYEYHWCIVRRLLVPTVTLWTVLLSATTLFAGQSASPSGDSVKSLGDIAKQVRPKDAKVTTKHVFTDDDVAHGQSGASVPDPKAQSKSSISRAESLVNDLADLNPRELGENIVGDVKFPGREVWENKLYAQKEKLVAAARAWLAIQKDGSGAGVADAAANSYNLQRTMYNDLEMGGKAQADSWKNRRNDGAGH